MTLYCNYLVNLLATYLNQRSVFREDKNEILSSRWKITMRSLDDLSKSQVLLSGSGREETFMSIRATNGDVVILNTNEQVLNIFNIHG